MSAQEQAGITPGDWYAKRMPSRVGDADWCIAWSADGELVADVVYHQVDALVMAAAPDLLESLRALVDAGGIGPESLFHDARAAIAKATGVRPK